MGHKYSTLRNNEYSLLNENEFLYSDLNTYSLDKVLGSGVYGKVAQCSNILTNEKFAVKFVRRDMAMTGKREIAVLENLRKLDQDKNNMVKCIENFTHKGHVCLVFEMLQTDLYHFLESRDFKPLHLSEIRVIAQQMLVALDALKSMGMVHADIKPDNIMLVNHQLQPFRVKLIDFGLAGYVSKLSIGRAIQAIGYRAPEVLLGLPLTEAIDMWSLGCVLAYLYLGWNLYPTRCRYQAMMNIVEMNGMPDEHLLEDGIYTHYYFAKNPTTHSWRMRTEEEYMTISGQNTMQGYQRSYFTNLNQITRTRPRLQGLNEAEDTRAFISLLRQMLDVNPENRLTPIQGLRHCFITMEHLQTPDCNSYLASAVSLLENSQQLESSDDDSCASTSQSSTTCTSDDTKTTSGIVDRTTNQNHNEPPMKTGLDDSRKTPAGPNEGTSPASSATRRLRKTVRGIKKRIIRFFSSLSCTNPRTSS